MFYRMKKAAHFRKFQKSWRKKNPHNTMNPKMEFDINCVEVGRYSYGDLNVMTHGASGRLLIGDFCSIGPNVMFILSADHATNCISTFPFKVKCTNKATIEGISKGNIILEDDVWIGYGATIMSGVTIHQGAIVAAGAVVTNDVTAYAVVAGVPAKIIKYRFSKEICKELQLIDYSKMNEKMIKEHIKQLYEPIQYIEQLDWLPRK